jgi:hypothetical protein
VGALIKAGVFMLTKSVIALLMLWSFSGHALNDMKDVRLNSCGPLVCTQLITAAMFRSSFTPSMLAFADAEMSLVEARDGKKLLQHFAASDGYYDMQAQVIVLRGLKNSKYQELVYNITQNKFIYF